LFKQQTSALFLNCMHMHHLM